ncbi:hypothetical protein HV438_12895 [Bacillus sporothermodurans]|uniref:hypothetical protein n=1 Tax=Heyndrickxia sporothermodurans TaxID=46224 RepID=UPI00192CAF9C|nr:hypothetical protein [Heyndrickxia sporothermodurans]MBL5779118.1 hypothetical protein [Heyndrickxia sporothermodurans]MED3651726.1 hypothetical protein [Heyndrickxia sporothermodurans]MED3656274.1 hypothetical protein [Heyndrickxia sporothermodurans]MED3699622.1 hypothetical protein [Heyndrickxia sporothermodurans]MED3782633.1 hypothetical protein [Heyndrickxia sporothermodurans]
MRKYIKESNLYEPQMTFYDPQIIFYAAQTKSYDTQTYNLHIVISNNLLAKKHSIKQKLAGMSPVKYRTYTSQ